LPFEIAVDLVKRLQILASGFSASVPGQNIGKKLSELIPHNLPDILNNPPF
jgi:hypothetical protein